MLTPLAREVNREPVADLREVAVDERRAGSETTAILLNYACAGFPKAWRICNTLARCWAALGWQNEPATNAETL